MKVGVVLLAVLGFSHGASLGGPRRNSAAESEEKTSAPVVVKSNGRAGLMVAAAGVCGSAAMAAVPSARKAVSGLFRGGSSEKEEASTTAPGEVASSSSEGSSKAAEKATNRGRAAVNAARKSGGSSAEGGERPRQQLALSPERLAQIGKLSEVLTPIAEELAMVPAFTVTVGNTSAPLTIPHGDGERLAYFFVEYMDAELFKRRLQERSPEVQLQVAALSLAQVIAAYSSDEVKSAEVRERFVLIPTMGAVTDALDLMQEPPPPERLSAASGLVPVFHIPSLLAQSASGKQRKILFFRMSDALNMYKNISLSQGDPEMPSEPDRILVSDLQTVAASLVATNSTDGVVFAPSSTALRVFRGSATQGGEQTSAAQGDNPSSPPASSIADDGDASLGISDDDEDDGLDEDEATV